MGSGSRRDSLIPKDTPPPLRPVLRSRALALSLLLLVASAEGRGLGAHLLCCSLP